MKKFILLIILINFNFILAEEKPAIVQFAFDKMAADSVYSYSYKKTTENPEEIRVIAYDAACEGDDQWKLISINGEPPTKKELKEFFKTMANTSDKGKKNISLTSDEMFEFKKISDSDGLITFQCKLNDVKNKKMMDKVLCKITVDKADSTLKCFKMALTEPVSPIVSVKLDEFSMEMNFQKMADTGATRIQELKSKIKGKAMVFKELDEQVTEKYYDYKLVSGR